MSIQVGILDGLRITKVEKSSDGLLNIAISEGTASSNGQAPAAAGASDIFSDLNDTSESSLSNGFNYIHWPYKIDDYNKTPDDILKAIKTSKEFLNHILRNYMTEDKIQWNVMAGINIDPSNPDAAKQQLMNQAVVAKIYDNQVSQFINMISSHVGDQSPLFRFKLTRQSKTKHYATLPRFAPFMEPMSVSKDQSKLSFSKWEKDNGYDSGTPLDDAAVNGTSGTPDAPVDPQAAADVDTVFGTSN